MRGSLKKRCLGEGPGGGKLRAEAGVERKRLRLPCMVTGEKEDGHTGERIHPAV